MNASILPELLLFIHIPKTAGTSLSFHIRKSIEAREAGSDVMLHDHIEWPEGRDQTLKRASQARYVHGHYSWETSQSISVGRKPYIFTVLRNPRDRLRSLYFFLKNLPSDGNDVQKSYAFIKQLDPAGFLHSEDTRIQFQINNFMVRQLSGSLDSEALIMPSNSVQTALQNLSRMDYVAFYQTFDADLLNIANQIGLPLDKDKIPYKNATTPAGLEPDELAKQHREFYEALYEFEDKFIGLDLQLYHTACEQFLKRS